MNYVMILSAKKNNNKKKETVNRTRASSLTARDNRTRSVLVTSP